MKLTIFGYPQDIVLKYDIDVVDLVILDWIRSLIVRPGIKTIRKGNTILYWVDHNTIVSDLPFLKIEKRTLRRRLSNLVSKGILSKKLVNRNMTYYGMGSRFSELIYEKEERRTPATTDYDHNNEPERPKRKSLNELMAEYGWPND